ncbi:MAG: hypothetical protein ACRYHA_19615 [Janthinobacterium lividum]
MSTVFMMSARMCTIATTCVVLLCLLLFAIGVQVGQRLDARAMGDHAGVASTPAAAPAEASPPAAVAPPSASAGASAR